MITWSVASLAQSSDSARSWDVLETALSAISDLFCDQFGFDGTFRMAVEDQSLEAAGGGWSDVATADTTESQSASAHDDHRA